MQGKDFPQPQPEPRQSRFPDAARLVEDIKKLPWPDWTGEALRGEFKGIKNDGLETESGVATYIVDDQNESSFRPDYWVIGRIMDQEDSEFMEHYLSTEDLGTSNIQVARNRLEFNRKGKGQKIDLGSIDRFEERVLDYEKEQKKFFKEVTDGYTDVLSIINWAKVLDDSKRSGIPVEEHPEFEYFSLEGFIVSNVEDSRGISEQIGDEIQNHMILESLEKDPTGVNLLQLRENAIRSRLNEEGENPDQHPWLIGFEYGRKRFGQLVDYLLKNEDIAG